MLGDQWKDYSFVNWDFHGISGSNNKIISSLKIKLLLKLKTKIFTNIIKNTYQHNIPLKDRKKKHKNKTDTQQLMHASVKRVQRHDNDVR